ncbi:thioredoxin reductase [Gemmatirosa kalamazoonensis]|uniref:Thioredoxin reductase n=1 Tax=Gemmatirosa kalamazoonensis TaxID=861299 RepID=W0RL09_9BACT|nr:thioredoxin-disulfide reductase [Gemmatirosa kalamazoonensis]AHG91127.1 thioredoxin reductase [Gemmatirosa kalamazoonensis]
MAASNVEKVVIIGSGPAAWTAAVYAARASLNPVVYEGEVMGIEVPGGQLMLTTEIENFPGFPEPISGQELMQRMKEQAERYGTRVVGERIVEVDLVSEPKRLTSSGGTQLLAHTVIVATGASANWLGLPNELRLAQSGGGVSACAVCDGALPFFRNRVLAVVGGGDTAMEEAMYLTKFASEVLIVHRRDAFRASKAMQQRVLGHAKTRVLWNTRVVDVIGDDAITGLRVEDTASGAQRDIEVGGLFVAIGHTPNTAFLKGQVETTPHGYVVTAPGRTATSVPGVFAAGDVADDYYRQAITSAGTGCMAALEAERYLAHHGIGESPVLETAETAPPETVEA